MYLQQHTLAISRHTLQQCPYDHMQTEIVGQPDRSL